MNSHAQKLDSSNLQQNLQQSLQIGAVTVPNRIFLAPMSGVTDVPFRQRAAQAGAGLVVSEMVASQEFVKGSHESIKRSRPSGAGIHMVQLAGREAHWMGEAAKAIEAAGADVIDINMGCPAKKVTGGYSGSALMRDLDHAMTLVEATVNAVGVPVTLKMRLGWDDNTINAPELAKRAEDAGVQMVTVHGRTRCQFYGGTADWSAVRAVREAISIPLTINGDICDMPSAVEALRLSGADAVMLGRAHYGRPWLAGDLANARDGLTDLGLDLTSYVEAHYEAMLDHYGIETGLRHARKHLGWYLDAHAVDCPAQLRQRMLTEVNPKAVVECIRSAFDNRAVIASTGERKAA